MALSRWVWQVHPINVKMPVNCDFPIAATLSADALHVTFAAIPPCEFGDAFSHETIARHNQVPVTRISYPRESLERYREKNSALSPVGIIMHTARVGSTLQVRLLRCIRGLSVYSEPPVLNDLLMPPWGWKRLDMIAALRFVIDLIGRHAEADFVIKLRSWNSLFADAIIEALPNTPWVFGVRHPSEIGVSVQRRPPTWMRARLAPDNPFVHFAQACGDVSTEEDYFASMLAAFYASVGGLNDDNGMLLDYDQLPAAVWEDVCPHFRLSVTRNEIANMQAASLFDAKCAIGEQRVFVPDSNQKRAAASLALRRATEAFALPALRRLQEGFGGKLIVGAAPYEDICISPSPHQK